MLRDTTFSKTSLTAGVLRFYVYAENNAAVFFSTSLDAVGLVCYELSHNVVQCVSR